MPPLGVFEHDRIELVYSGTFRRAADYGMEDASGVVLGRIAEHIPHGRWPLGRLEPLRAHRYEVTDESGALVASSHSRGSRWGEVRGEVNDAHGAQIGRIYRRRWAAMFPVSLEGNGTLSGMQILRGSREAYAAQFVDRAGDRMAEIEATGSSRHGPMHRFLRYRLTFGATADKNQRVVVLGTFPILHMSYVAPQG